MCIFSAFDYVSEKQAMLNLTLTNLLSFLKDLKFLLRLLILRCRPEQDFLLKFSIFFFFNFFQVLRSSINWSVPSEERLSWKKLTLGFLFWLFIVLFIRKRLIFEDSNIAFGTKLLKDFVFKIKLPFILQILIYSTVSFLLMLTIEL